MMAKTIRTALGCAVAMLSLAIAARAEPYHHHRRSSAYGDFPAYWGVERRPRSYRDCCGWRRTKLHPGEASVRQLNPRLRARSDGRLLEQVGTPPPARGSNDLAGQRRSGACYSSVGLPMVRPQARASPDALVEVRRLRAFSEGALQALTRERVELSCERPWHPRGKRNYSYAYLWALLQTKPILTVCKANAPRQVGQTT